VKAEQKLRQAEAHEQKLREELENMEQREMENKRKVSYHSRAICHSYAAHLLKLVLKNRVREYVSSRESELEEQKAWEEVKRAQEAAERRLANKELEKFRERVSLPPSHFPLFRLLTPRERDVEERGREEGGGLEEEGWRTRGKGIEDEGGEVRLPLWGVWCYLTRRT
jgi:hypothetical protein